MRKLSIITFLIFISFVTSLSHAAERQVSSIEHYRINKNIKCADQRKLSAFISDYAMYGYDGGECISMGSKVSIDGELINGITLSKNKYSDASLKPYDINISFSEDINQGDGEATEYAAFIGDYFLGVYQFHQGSGSGLYLMVLHRDAGDLINNLNRLNSDVKTVLVE